MTQNLYYSVKNFRVLRVRATIFCSSEVNAMGGFHIMDSSRWQGHGALLHLSEHSPPLLSTLYEPLPKHLISVLGYPPNPILVARSVLLTVTAQQDNHAFFKLANEPLKGVIRHIGSGTRPPDYQAVLV